MRPLRSLSGMPLLLALSLSPAAQGADAPPAPEKSPEKASTETTEAPKPQLSDEELLIQSRVAMEQINAAKERSFRSKAALADLRAEAVASDSGQNSAIISLLHRNELDSSLVLVGVTYSIDGTPLFTKDEATGLLDRIGEQTIFSARVVPGTHVLTVQYDTRARGGLFSALGSELMTVHDKYTFKIEPRRTTTIASTVFNTGTQTRAPKDQLEVAFAQRGVREVKAEEPAPAVVTEPAVEAPTPVVAEPAPASPTEAPAVPVDAPPTGEPVMIIPNP